MDKAWQIKVWGVRGSAPRPAADYMAYGGNTVCTSIEHGGHVVVLDAGTGLSVLGASLAARRDVTHLDILLSHLHVDHVLGLYLFQPLFNPNMEIHFYGGMGLSEHLGVLMGSPFWPLGLQDFPARLAFHEVRPGAGFALNGLSVSTMAGRHPGGSLLYRLEGEGRRLTCALDCETDEANLPSLARFAQGSDLLTWDASFTLPDLRTGWGHFSWEQGQTLGCTAGVRQVLMTHYSWDYTDEFLRRQEKQAAIDGGCLFAREGMVITL